MYTSVRRTSYEIKSSESLVVRDSNVTVKLHIGKWWSFATGRVV